MLWTGRVDSQDLDFVVAMLALHDEKMKTKLVKFRDAQSEKVRKATLPDDELAGYPVETDLEEALKKHRPDAVIVANPTSLHLDVALPAVQAGCAILLEKPMAPNEADCRKILHDFFRFKRED